MKAASWIAVDWGTSNLRAWGISSSGDVQFARTSDSGMSKIARGDYPGVLQSLVGADLPDGDGPVDVLICGMAGARQGWLEAPYLDAPTPLTRLAAGAVRPEMPGRMRPRILPGVCFRRAGEEDVIRGEETQVLGVASLVPGFSGVVIMPGTHSKWVEMRGDELGSFTTVMTGELYDLLAHHSVLRHSLAGEMDEAEREEGFDRGLDLSIAQPQALTSLLFKVRATSLLSGRSSGWCAGLMSGLLIGAEVSGNAHRLGQGETPLVGGTKLCGLYAKALSRLGRESRIIDATDATLAGIKAARQQG